MSGYYYDDSDMFEDEGPGRQGGGSGLRKQLEDALSEIRNLRTELNQEKRAKALTDLFTEKGKDPAAIALVPEDADPKAWLEKNAAYLADAKKPEVLEQRQEQQQNGEQGHEAAPEVPDPALEEERMAMETLTGVVGEGTGIPSTASADPIAKMQSFQTEEELLAFIRSNGAG